MWTTKEVIEDRIKSHKQSRAKAFHQVVKNDHTFVIAELEHVLYRISNIEDAS